MAARFCTVCGNLVTTAFCPSCGALQADTDAPASESPENLPTQAWSTALQPDQQLEDNPTQPQGSQAWHPFESPSWTPEIEQPMRPGGVPLLPEQSNQYGSPVPDATLAAPQHFGPEQSGRHYPGPPYPGSPYAGSPQQQSPASIGSSGTGEFMGVSNWQAGTASSPNNRSSKANWVLGGLAAAAVVAVLVAIAFIIIKGNSGQDIATPDTNKAPTTVDASPTSESALTTAGPTTAPSPGTVPAVPVPGTTQTTTTEVAGSTGSGSAVVPPASSEAAAQTSPPEPTPDNPRGGPEREITCNTGYIVQVASALTEADFEARVSQLRASGQLPTDSAVATTAASCQIFTAQTNTIVLYAGPYPDKYAACAARLSGAPDSFIKGTTPETATEYVSCLCPAAIDTLPPVTELNQTGVWVGELQRVLANKLKYKIPDLNTLWGTYSPSTIEAVNAFQTDQGLPVTGQVDAATWQKLQAAQC